MASQVGSILRKATKQKDEPYNVLTYCTHERFSSNMRLTNANYYMLQGGNGFGLKGKWKECYASVPKNHILLEPTDNPLEALPNWVDLDFIISGHKWGQLQGSQQLSQILQIPIIQIEHTEPTSDEIRKNIPVLKQMRGDINVFISEYNAKAWGWGEGDDYEVIHHGIDSNIFKPHPRTVKGNHVLTVGNDIINRAFILGFDLFDEAIIKSNIPHRVVGDTNGYSQPAKNTFDLVKMYNEASVYVNPSRFSPIPMSCLEALSCGLPVIALRTGMLPEIIVDGYNGYLVDNAGEIKEHALRLLNSPDECKRLGENARQTILEKFPLDKFTQAWNNIFDRAFEIRK